MGDPKNISPTATAASGPINDEIAHFQSIPWCAKHLSSSSSSDSDSSPLIVSPVWSREPKPNFDDALFSVTFKTHDTIPAFVCFYPGPEDRQAYLPRLQALVSLGNLVAGYGGVTHGGVVATVFDETLSLLMPASRWAEWRRRRRQRNNDTAHAHAHAHGTLPVAAAPVTAYLHTRYVRKVALPGTYLVTVRLVRKDGRKVFVEGEMEDEHGVTVASAEALFVEPREKL